MVPPTGSTLAGTDRLTNRGCAAAAFFFTIAGTESHPGFWVVSVAVADKTPRANCTGGLANAFNGWWEPTQGGCLDDPSYGVELCLEYPVVLGPNQIHYDARLCALTCASGHITVSFLP